IDKKNLALAYENTVVTFDNPKGAIGVTVPVGGVLELRCKGDKLAPGSHSFKLQVTAGGDMSIDFERDVA
nr:hypothetical protein [Candidatus Sigynarchaeota archaeon]